MLDVDGEFFHGVMTSLGRYPLWLILSAYASDMYHLSYLMFVLAICVLQTFDLYLLLIISPTKF